MNSLPTLPYCGSAAAALHLMNSQIRCGSCREKVFSGFCLHSFVQFLNINIPKITRASRSNRCLLPADTVEHALRRALLQYAQLAEMMSQCGSFAPDEATVNDFTIKDMDEQVMKKYLLNRFAVAMERNGVNETNLHDYTLEQMAHFVVGGIRLEGLLKELTKKVTK